jgi:diguanylate cyclase (GGDEF)-like protein
MNMISSGMSEFLQRYEGLYFWLPLLVLIFAAVYLVRAIYGNRKKALENSVYIIYCSFAIAIAGAALINTVYGIGGAFAYVGIGAYAAYYSLPAIFFLHVWSQVSYKKISIVAIICSFIVPAFLTVLSVISYMNGEFTPDIWRVQLMLPLQYSGLLYICYWLFMTIKSYLLCFNVFYQMPGHMKASTGLLVAGASVISVETIFALLDGERSTFLLFLLALAFVLERAFAGFFRASASNVIATSREFVFSNLSTMILILSRKERILEWNRSRDNFVFKLLSPKYRQPFSDYREKLLKAGNGVVSNHDENVITLTHNGLEHHLLITPAMIREGEREFGQLIEIADITHIYSVLRYIESIAAYDHLTGLYNRNAYIGKASTILSAENLPLLIIVGDVNTLKLINDSVGHIAGDRLLVTISKVIAEFAPGNAFVARIGGDEIAVLVPNADESVAVKFAGNVRRKTASIFDAEFGKPDISLGWAVARSVHDDYNAVFKSADQMMYKEKKAFKKARGISLSGALPERRDPAFADGHAYGTPPFATEEGSVPAPDEPEPFVLSDITSAPEPVAPEPAAPVAPGSSYTWKPPAPESVAPLEPELVMPLAPEPIVPVEPEPIVPLEPIVPEPIVPLEPELVVPLEPEPVAPLESEPIVPLEPEPIVPLEPEPIVPLEPEPIVPLEPEPVVPLEAEPAGPAPAVPAASGSPYTWRPPEQPTAPAPVAPVTPFAPPAHRPTENSEPAQVVTPDPDQPKRSYTWTPPQE